MIRTTLALALAALQRSFWLTCGQEGDQWDGESCAVPSQIYQSNLPVKYPVKSTVISTSQNPDNFQSILYIYLSTYSYLPLLYPSDIRFLPYFNPIPTPTPTSTPTPISTPTRLLQIPPYQRQRRWLRTFLCHAQRHRYFRRFR